jgi:hypothetical protein
MNRKVAKLSFFSTPASRGVCIPVLLFIAFCAPTVRASPAKSVMYRQTVSIGSTEVNIDKACVLLSASMSSGEFFKNLDRTDSASGEEFYKDSRRVLEFPDRITIRIQAVNLPCIPSQIAVPRDSLSTLLHGLRFEAQWQRSLTLRFAKVVSVKLFRPPVSELTDTVTYVLAVEAARVPLTNSLIIDVDSSDGKKLTSFKVRL